MAPDSSSRSSDFPATPWTLVLRSNGTDTLAAQALSEVCRLYWYPLYTFVRREGFPPHDAEDFTQGFFASFLQRSSLESASQEKGRLRNYLLRALKNHIAQVKRNEGALKRGGGREIISIDFADAEGRFANEPIDDISPDKLFDQQWLEVTLEHVLESLEREYAAKDKKPLFDRLSGFLVPAADDPDYATLSQDLGLSQGALRTAVSRLRKRYRELLHRQVAATVPSQDEVRDELTQLMGSYA